MKNKKSLILSSVMVLLPMVAGIILWDQLPERMPSHWGIDGQVDGWSGKFFGVFGLPLMMLGFHWICALAMKLDKPEWKISFRNWFTFNKTAKAMLYLHYATSYDYGFMREKSVFNVDARVQKTFLDGSLTAAIHAGDIFRTLRNRWTGYYAVSTMSKEAYSYTQNIGISLSYNFNAARSRYKGTGAGNAEKSRL